MTLGDICTLVSGQHLNPDQYGEVGRIPYFSGPSDLTNEIGQVRKWVKASSNFGVCDDILITVKGSGAGGVWRLRLNKAALGRQLMAVHTEHYKAGFIYQFLLTKLERLEAMATGNLIPGLSRPNLLTLPIPIPSSEEQLAVSDFLSSVDERLDALEKRSESASTHKTALMQQLFPSLEEIEQ